MNEKRGTRVARSVMVTGILALLFLGLDTAPTIPAVPTAVPEAPDLEHAAVMEDLAEWMSGSTAVGPKLDAILVENMTDMIRSKPQRFQLFRDHLDHATADDFLRGLPYGRTIDATARKHSVDGLLLAALVEAESSFLPNAVSPVGAVGLTQVMPSTAEWLGARGDLKDPGANLDVGARYLSRLLDRFDGDVELALAAYNAGPTNVLRYGGIPPFRETRNYVDKVLSIYAGHNLDVWETSSVGQEVLLAAR